jgi:alkylation response protein AidB-like acyl-CoA dehydrogenase
VQGGKPIKQHVAVQQMLADCRSTVETVELLLQSLAGLALTRENLGKVFNVRAQAHNLLCTAANHVLQVFGGSGYVRETGLEKIVRDNNHLRLLCGSPSELLLFLSEWEAHG